MPSLDPLLREVLRIIEPSPEQKDGARRSHTYLRQRLADGNIGKRIIGSYLSGSYARETAIAPLDDVDIVFVIDPTAWQDPLRKLFDVKPSPEKVLRTFASAIRHRYDRSSLRVQRRSVRLRLNHLNIDAVPAISVQDRDGLIWIPDRKDDKWLLSGPLVHSETASQCNKRNGGLLKPLVKLAKLWNSRIPPNSRLKSFAIETMLVRLFSEHRMTSLEHGLLSCFDFIGYLAGDESVMGWRTKCGMSLTFWTCCVPDTAETDSNVAANVADDKRLRFVRQAARARDALARALHSDVTEDRADFIARLFRA